MRNQAYFLKSIMENKRKEHFNDFKQALSQSQNIITVSSGKGGVGKSTFVTNLSIMLTRLKKKVLVMDVDLGLANLHILFNQKKARDLSHVFKEDFTLREIITPTPYGVDIIMGGNGLTQLVDLSEEEIWLFLDQIKDFQEYDFIILDVGAGISKNVLTFLRVANQVILITTPEPTSLTDAYGLLKAFSIFTQQSYAFSNLFVVVNKSISYQQSKIAMTRLEQTCEQYLNIKIKKLGYLPKDDYLVKSIYDRIPLVESMPVCQFSKLILGISKFLIKETSLIRNSKDLGVEPESLTFEKLIKDLIS